MGYHPRLTEALGPHFGEDHLTPFRPRIRRGSVVGASLRQQVIGPNPLGVHAS